MSIPESFDSNSIESILACGMIAYEYNIPAEAVKKEVEISLEILNGKKKATAEEISVSEKNLGHLKEKLSFISELQKFNLTTRKAIVQAANAYIVSPKEVLDILVEETIPFFTKVTWLVAIQSELEFLKQKDSQPLPIERELGLG